MPDTQTPLDEALTVKAHAEAEKFRQEALAFQADRAWKEAQAREAQAKARAAEFHSENSRINTEANLRQEKVALSANHHHHVFDFHAPVCDESVEVCLAQLAVWDRQDKECPMHIVFNSPGGSLIDGMHLFDQLTLYSKREWDDRDIPKGTHSTTVSVRGYAASMAGILVQAADRRLMGPEASFLVHEVSAFASGKMGEIKDEVKWLDKVSERVANIFVIRSGGKTPLEEFKAGWNRTDWWLDSEAALERGFIDGIG